MSATPLPRWDLSRLYRSPQDPRIAVDLARLVGLTTKFAETFRGKVGPGTVSAALGELETIADLEARLSAFAELSAAVDSEDAEIRALRSRVEESLTAAGNRIRFFDLEFLALPEAEQLLAESEVPANPRHALRTLRAEAAHRRSEAEEMILAEKSLTGREAWSKLFDDRDSTATFDFEGKTMTQDEILRVATRDPARTRREAAYRAFSAKIGEELPLRAAILDAIVADQILDARLTKFEKPEDSRHLANQTTRASVDALLTAVEESYDLCERWYRLKSRLTGIADLHEWDRYAPIFSPQSTSPLPRGEGGPEGGARGDEGKSVDRSTGNEANGAGSPDHRFTDSPTKDHFTWDEATSEVLATFAELGEESERLVQKFFDEGRIDAEPRKGKSGGAFCSGISEEVGHFVLLNFTNDWKSVSTLAHELGHGLHDQLAYPENSPLLAHPPLTLAETASMFAELLLAERRLQTLSEPKARLAFLGGMIEDDMAGIHRQAAFTLFERRIYETRAARGALDAETLSELWQEEIQRMFGDGLKLTDAHRSSWAYISHFIHTPFYTYAYAFGQLLVYALFAEYRRLGEAFVPGYLNLLRAGGSDDPRALVKRHVGLDLEDPEFWRRGVGELERRIEEAERLAAELGAS